MNRIISLFILIIFSYSCGQISEEEILNADFYDWDLSPPVIYSPEKDQEFGLSTNPQITLSWQSKEKILRFRLEIAKDAAFQKMIEGFPYYLKRNKNEPPEAKFVFTPKEEGTYYFRIRSEGKEIGDYSEVRKFHVFSAIHVYCPATESCNDTEARGFSYEPVRQIHRALAKAKNLGVPVKVAARGGTAGYAEVVQLVNGVDLVGGYSYPDWEYNPTTNKTTIEITATRVALANTITEPTVFRGFEVKTTANNLSGDCAFYSYNSSDKLIVEENKFYFGQSNLAQPRYGIFLENTNIVFRKNVVEGTTTAVGGNSIGIFVRGGTALIEENQIVANNGVGGYAYGIKLESFQGTIRKNTIIPSKTSSVQNRWGIYADGAGTSFLAEENTIDFHIGGGISAKLKGVELIGNVSNKITAQFKNNIIKLRNGPTGTSLCQGVYLEQTQNTVLDKNTIEMCHNPERESYGIYAKSAENLTLRENFIKGSGPTQFYPCYQVYMETSSKGVKLEKNQLFGCQKAAGHVYGVFSLDSNVTLLENQIVAGWATGGNNYGVYTEANWIISTLYAEKNIISGGYNSVTNGAVYGVYVTSSVTPQSAYLKDNYIFAGKATNTSTVSAALYISASDNMGLIYSLGNVLYGGEVTNYSRSVAFYKGRFVLDHNLLFSGVGNTESRGVSISSSSLPEILDLHHNVIVTQGSGTLRAVMEANANSDPTSLVNNIFLNEGSGSFTFYYDENSTSRTDVSLINDFNNTTQDSNKPSSGNLQAISGSDLYLLYPAFRLAFDGNGNNTYQGHASAFETENTFCSSLATASYILPVGLSNLLQITTKSCPVVNFTPALSRATVAGEVFFDFLSEPNSENIFRNKNGSLALNAALCSTAEKTVVLASGTSQSDCQNKFPLFKPYFNSGNCELKFYPGLTEFVGNGNGFCETGESCLFYPHIGQDAGRGSLVASTCSIPTVTVLQYADL